nr:NAD-dependent epimerase/dehydratase family protein [Hyphomonas sp.]
MVVIAGGGGFLGSAIARQYIAHGWRVVTLGLGGPTGQTGRQVVHHEGLISRDLLSAAMRQNGKPNLVIHSAGGASVGRSWEDPRGDFELSVASTAEILDFLRQEGKGASLLLVSSAAIYGNQHKTTLSETDPAMPVSPYGLHKHICEQLIMGEARMTGLATAIVRLFSVYGEGLRKQILWDILNRAPANSEAAMELWGHGGETRDFLHADDAADLIRRAAAAARPGETCIFNGASGRPVSVRDLAAQLLKIAGHETKLVFNGRHREGDPEHLCANPARSFTELGFRPGIQLGEGLKRYVEWFIRQSGPE